MTEGPERPQLQLLRILAASRQPAEGKVRFLDQLRGREGLIGVRLIPLKRPVKALKIEKMERIPKGHFIQSTMFQGRSLSVRVLVNSFDK